MPDPLNAAVIVDPLVIEQGISCERVFLLTDAAGTPLNLTGYAPITAHIHYGTVDQPGSVVPGGEITLANGRLTMPAPADGQVRMSLSPADTAAIPTGDYMQWFILEAPGGGRLMPWVRYVRVVPTPAGN